MTSPRKSRDPKTLRPATQLIHGGSMRSAFEETSEALFLTQGYLYDTMELSEARFKGEDPGFIYSRFANPTVSMFEKRMALLEGAEAARATASGMAAVTASLMGQLKAGDHIVAARALFGSCLYVVEELLPRFGVASTLVGGADLDAWRAALRPNTKTAFLESPTNPTLELVDIASVAEIMHGAGATLVGRDQPGNAATQNDNARAVSRDRPHGLHLRCCHGQQAPRLHHGEGGAVATHLPDTEEKLTPRECHSHFLSTGPVLGPTKRKRHDNPGGRRRAALGRPQSRLENNLQSELGIKGFTGANARCVVAGADGRARLAKAAGVG